MFPVVIEHVWDLNVIVNEKSLGGQLLQTLFGYNGNPSLTEVISYVVYIVIVLFAVRRGGQKVEAHAAQPQA